jgi:hypothetical protein
MEERERECDRVPADTQYRATSSLCTDPSEDAWPMRAVSCYKPTIEQRASFGPRPSRESWPAGHKAAVVSVQRAPHAMRCEHCVSRGSVPRWRRLDGWWPAGKGGCGYGGLYAPAAQCSHRQRGPWRRARNACRQWSACTVRAVGVCAAFRVLELGRHHGEGEDLQHTSCHGVSRIA